MQLLAKSILGMTVDHLESTCGTCATKKQRVDREKKIESSVWQSRLVRNITRHTNIINRLLNRQTKCASNRNFGFQKLMFGAVDATPKHLSCGNLLGVNVAAVNSKLLVC